MTDYGFRLDALAAHIQRHGAGIPLELAMGIARRQQDEIQRLREDQDALQSKASQLIEGLDSCNAAYIALEVTHKAANMRYQRLLRGIESILVESAGFKRPRGQRIHKNLRALLETK